MSYIEREALVDYLQKIPIDLGYREVNEIRDFVNRIPAADVRPVKRGKWEQTIQPMGWHEEECATCSVCGEDFVLDEWAMDEFTNLMHFCPNCGADMREEQT